MKFHKIFSG